MEHYSLGCVINSSNWEEPHADHLLNPTSDRSCCSAPAELTQLIKYPPPYPPFFLPSLQAWVIVWDGKEGLGREREEERGRLMEEWSVGQKKGKINCGFSWEHNLGECMQPTADNIIILRAKAKQNKTKNPASLHYSKEDVRGVLSSVQDLIQQNLLDVMLVFFISATSLRNINK